MSNTAFDPYATLGLRPGADETQVREAYRRLARLHHPDRSRDPRATERMQAINRAWAVLSDPAWRNGDGVSTANGGRSSTRNWSAAEASRARWSAPSSSWSSGPARSWSAGSAEAAPYRSAGSSAEDDLAGLGVLVAVVLLAGIGPVLFGILPLPFVGLFILLALGALARGTRR